MGKRIKKYSSVTLSENTLQYIDDIGLKMAAGNAQDVGGEINIPSRRKVVQDSLHLLLHELYPEMLKEFRLVIEDSDSLDMCSDLKKYIQNKQYGSSTVSH